jgi:hypothetical protein
MGQSARLRHPSYRLAAARWRLVEQPCERRLLADFGGPAIGDGDRRIELAMGVVEPGRPLIVEIGQGAFFEDRGGHRPDWDDPVDNPGTTSGTRSTKSGGLSHASRNSLSRRAASAIALARGSSAYSAAGLWRMSDCCYYDILKNARFIS